MSKLTDEWENIIKFMMPDPSTMTISKEIYKKYITFKDETRKEIDKLYPNWNNRKYSNITLLEIGLSGKWNYILFICMEIREIEDVILSIRILHTNKEYEYASLLYKYFHNDIYQYGCRYIVLFYSSYMNDGKYSLRDELPYINQLEIIGYLTDRQISEIKRYIKSLGTYIDTCVTSPDTAQLDMNNLIEQYLDYRVFYSTPDKKISTVSSYAWTPVVKSDHSLTFDNAIGLTYLIDPYLAAQVVPIHLSSESIISNDILVKWDYISIYKNRVYEMPLIMFIDSIEEIYNNIEYNIDLLSEDQKIVLEQYISSL